MSFRIEKSIKPPDRRKPPCERARGKAAFGKQLEIASHVICLGGRNRSLLSLQGCGKILEVAMISSERVAAGAAFCREHLQEQLGQGTIRLACHQRPSANAALRI